MSLSNRALLDAYVLGGDLPAAAVLYSTWSDSLLPGVLAGEEQEQQQLQWPQRQHPTRQQQQKQQRTAVKAVDFFGVVSDLLQRKGSGVRLLPSLPAALQVAAAPRGLPADWQGPLGRPKPLPGSMGPALAAVDKAVRSAARDVRKLLCSPLPELVGRSPDIDFGVWLCGSLKRKLFRQASAAALLLRPPAVLSCSS